MCPPPPVNNASNRPDKSGTKAQAQPIVQSEKEIMLDKFFYKNLMKKCLKTMKYASVIRLAIALLINKLNVIKTVKTSLVGSIRFGLACVLFSAIQRILRRFLYLRTKLNQHL